MTGISTDIDPLYSISYGLPILWAIKSTIDINMKDGTDVLSLER